MAVPRGAYVYQSAARNVERRRYPEGAIPIPARCGCLLWQLWRWVLLACWWGVGDVLLWLRRDIGPDKHGRSRCKRGHVTSPEVGRVRRWAREGCRSWRYGGWALSRVSAGVFPGAYGAVSVVKVWRWAR